MWQTCNHENEVLVRRCSELNCPTATCGKQTLTAKIECLLNIKHSLQDLNLLIYNKNKALVGEKCIVKAHWLLPLLRRNWETLIETNVLISSEFYGRSPNYLTVVHFSSLCLQSACLQTFVSVLSFLCPQCEEQRNNFDFALWYNQSLRRDDPVSQLVACKQVNKSSVTGCGEQ